MNRTVLIATCFAVLSLFASSSHAALDYGDATGYAAASHEKGIWHRPGAVNGGDNEDAPVIPPGVTTWADSVSEERLYEQISTLTPRYQTPNDLMDARYLVFDVDKKNTLWQERHGFCRVRMHQYLSTLWK